MLTACDGGRAEAPGRQEYSAAAAADLHDAAVRVLHVMHDFKLGSMYADLHAMPSLRATTGQVEPAVVVAAAAVTTVRRILT
jgi:ABC-type hemin transport system ATPase subunit